MKNTNFKALICDLIIYLEKTFSVVLPNRFDQSDPREQLSHLISEIKKKSSPVEGRRLSFFGGKDRALNLDALSISFEYKRERLKANLSGNFCEAQALSNRNSQEILLLSSGQSGIFLVSYWIKHFLKLCQITTLSHTYIGAQEVFHQLEIQKKKFVPNSKTEILWICSSYDKLEFFDEIKACSPEVVVIDTTCWGLKSRFIVELIEKFPLIQFVSIRSHSKLDMMGVEYGSLGSVTLYKTANTRYCNYLESLILIIKVTGISPSIDDIPPYLFSQKFVEFSEQREVLLRKGAILINEHLRIMEGGFIFYIPPHCCYTFVKFPNKFSENHARGLVILLTSALLQEGIRVLSVPSFGFNYLNLSLYFDKNDSRLTLRVCPSPLREENRRFIELFKVIVGFNEHAT